MPAVKTLLQRSIRALDTGNLAKAAGLVELALKQLRDGAKPRLPWTPASGNVHSAEFRRRATRFLETILRARDGLMDEMHARELARGLFPEQPRVVGPSFYRPRFLEVVEGPHGNSVRVTQRGQRFLAILRRRSAKRDGP